MLVLLLIGTSTILGMLAGAGMLHLIPKLGGIGRAVSEWLCRAPGLDFVVTYFTVAPLFIGPIAAHRHGVSAWLGFLVAIIGQIAGMLIWQTLHERAHPADLRGPRIIKLVNGRVGTARNLTAVWLTALVTPLFWCTRVAEAFIYPLLHRLIGLPKYNSADWVNVSRHKFSGLIGHDLIWCLYCDWMTGVWSLGSEMLRNVESFWCPIRFRSDKKCANCSIDFPDVNAGWVPADATMADVVATLDKQYETGPNTPKPWFNAPVRLTVNQRPVDVSVEPAAK